MNPVDSPTPASIAAREQSTLETDTVVVDSAELLDGVEAPHDARINDRAMTPKRWLLIIPICHVRLSRLRFVDQKTNHLRKGACSAEWSPRGESNP